MVDTRLQGREPATPFKDGEPSPGETNQNQMLRCVHFARLLTGVLFLLAPASVAQQSAAPLRFGDGFPHLAGQALTRNRLDFPSVTAGKTAAVMFSYSRNGGKDARLWNEHLSEDFQGLPIYTIILLESVPGIFRGMALSVIKSDMPLSLQDRIVVMYQNATGSHGRQASEPTWS
jgi:hypothetical protein